MVESCGDIHALPEDCIANVLSLTSPKDACRLSLVTSTFCSASRSDTVWDRFLPSDYLDIISRSIDGRDSLLARFRCKKDLYLYLCDHPIVIDAGRKSFSLEKWSGKKCYVLAARDLIIVWGDTPQYWQWISLPESRFAEVAELLNVCWFKIDGKISMKMLSPNTNYAAYLVFKRRANFCGFHNPIFTGYVGFAGQESQTLRICLAESVPNESTTEYPKQRDDGWMEVMLGEYFVQDGGQDGDFEISLFQCNSSWKSGLIFPEVAELLSVWWFEIRGKISMKMLSPNTNYAAYLVFKRRANFRGFHKPIFTGYVGSAGQESQTLMICLDESVAIEGATEYPKQRDDGWMEVELGEYFVRDGGEDGDFKISLLRTNGVWKSGLIIQGIEIRPKYQN
ncbi:hypothetical protein BUALT_Bualt19G0060000 [Buddleja alternifolia]|uniref:F-box domain-containing protein n=1 Tax=Buddleja alternifolia TaxID=168488 RepID=A0AAV6W5D2_9LAMI|nr:hypothetical protein BUALT_Bualt19G0060000 [Buddleja alternifolia]